MYFVQDNPSNAFKCLGSTGNVYTVTIGMVPSCDCPDHLRSQDHCKHLIFILMRVLKVASTDPVLWQKALLQRELGDLLLVGSVSAEGGGGGGGAGGDASTHLANEAVRKQYLQMQRPKKKQRSEGGNGEDDGASAAAAAEEDEPTTTRRPVEDEDECPICFEELKGAAADTLAWCEAVPGQSCGKALHADCAIKWAKMRTPPTCAFCRTPWVKPEAAASSSSSEGYVNLGQLQGLSTTRQYYYGGYNRFRRHYGGGYRAADRRYNDDDDEDY